MLKEIRIKNFKSLRDTGVLEIKPITILVGPNSSGKSSLIQFLLMIKQTAESRDYRNPLIFDGTCIKLESYRNIIWKNNTNLNLEFEFSFEEGILEQFPTFANVKYHVVFYGKKGRVSGIHSFKFVDRKEGKVILTIRWGKEIEKPIIEECSFSDDIKKALSEHLTFLKFHPFFVLPIPDFEKDEKPIANAITSMYFFDNYFSRGICYLGPLREFPQRYYSISGTTLEDIGFKGERAVEVLIGRKDIVNGVRKWVKKFDLAQDVTVKSLRERTLAEIILKDPSLLFNVNLYDVGFGVSQILPIIVEGFYAPDGSILLIEQPEIHLHPKLQADMGDLLIEITKAKKKLIVETHSEHLLLRIQRRIAEGILNVEDVAIYYFNLTTEGTQITKMKIDETGRIENWPEGFFEEDIKESIAITKAIMDREKEKIL